MKRSNALTTRVLATVVILTSLFSAGYVPVQPANAETVYTNVFAAAGEPTKQPPQPLVNC